jgi:hypothetical protein
MYNTTITVDGTAWLTGPLPTAWNLYYGWAFRYFHDTILVITKLSTLFGFY